MIRLSEIKLTLAEAEQPEAPLRAAARRVLGLQPEDIRSVEVFKRSFDARKADLAAVYIVDVTLTDPTREALLLANFTGHPHIAQTPDMAWRPPVTLATPPAVRPVVVGFGPCGIFAALVLAQM